MKDWFKQKERVSRQGFGVYIYFSLLRMDIQLKFHYFITNQLKGDFGPIQSQNVKRTKLYRTSYGMANANVREVKKEIFSTRRTK